MKRTVKLCAGCVDMLNEHFPYRYPDGSSMNLEDLVIREVTDVSDCDNHPSNLDREPVWSE